MWNLSRTWDGERPARPDGTRTRVVRDRPASRVAAHPLPRRQRRAGPGSHAGGAGRDRACRRARTASAFVSGGLSRPAGSPPFDLTSPVMVRAGVAILGPEHYELTLTRHHISSDQWSSGIFRRELATVYDDFVAGREPSLPELRLQFNDYAWWEQRHRKERVDRQLRWPRRSRRSKACRTSPRGSPHPTAPRPRPVPADA